MSKGDALPKMSLMKPTILFTAAAIVVLVVIGAWVYASRDSAHLVDPSERLTTTPGEADSSVTISPAGDPSREVSGVGGAPEVTEPGDRPAPRRLESEPVRPETAERTELSPSEPARPAAAKAPPPRPTVRETVSGVVVDDEGSPISRALVVITAWEQGARPAARRAMTDDEGGFDFGVKLDRRFSLSVRHRDFLPARLIDLEYRGTPIEVQLSEGGVVEGSVFDESGNPASHAYVRVQSLVGKMVKGQRADEDGVFRVSAIPPGTYEIVVTSRDALEDEESGDGGGGGSADPLARSRVVVESGSPASIELRLGKSQ